MLSEADFLNAVKKPLKSFSMIKRISSFRTLVAILYKATYLICFRKLSLYKEINFMASGLDQLVKTIGNLLGFIK